MKLEAAIENLDDILVNKKKFYQIPDYQRPYSWDKENLSDLIDDLTNSYLENNDEDYFCGSLVLVDNTSDNRLDIIDGQQRTTTFTIISCVFRDLFMNELNEQAQDYINQSIQDKYEKDKRKLKFLTNEKYQIDFEETVLKKINFVNTRDIEKQFPDNRYLQNAHYLKKFITENILEHKININDFVIWFFENIVLTVITCPNQDSAIQIFNVLNDRGMPLSSIDILKASLMQKLKDNMEDRNAFKAKWEDINSNLKFADLTIDDMLTTYLYYKITTNPKNRLDKELARVFNREGKGALEIINEISEFSKSYINLSTINDKYIFTLRYLRHKIYWNSILTTALFINYKDIDELKKLLVAYYYQNWLSGATVARIKQTSFNILDEVKKNSDIEIIKNIMNENLEKYSTTKKYYEEVEGSFVYGRKWDKSILLLINYFYDDNPHPTFIPINNKLHLEHILPQTPTEYWKNIFSEEERGLWTNSLANLTLLSMRKNIQAQNYSFEKKKEAYSNADNVVSSFDITKTILSSEKWDIEELDKRKTILLDRLKDKIDLF